MDGQGALTGDERAELERLRAEVATLRLQVRQPEATAGGGATGRAARQRWRTVVAALLVVLGCVLAPLAGVAVWARNQVTNTDRHVATVAPLATDPASQNAIGDQIIAQVFTYIDVQGLTNQALDALTGRGVRPQSPISCERSPLRSPTACRASPAPRWAGSSRARRARTPSVQANRLAHEELVKALTGEGGGAITVEKDTVSINLAAVIQTVKRQLLAAGFTLAERIPQVNASFVLFQSKDITRARSAFNLLTTLGNWLPVIALLLLALGVYGARDHRPALVAAGLGVAVAMLLLAVGLAVFRSIDLDAVPAFVLGLVVAAGAFLTGQSGHLFWSRPPVRSAHPNGMKTSTSAILILAGWESLARRVHG